MKQLTYNIFEDIKVIYTKSKDFFPPKDRETYQNISITKWLSYDEDNLSILSKLIPYMWLVSPETYFMLLYFNIPKKEKVPFLHKIHKEEKEDNKLFNKIKEVLGWSDKELKLYFSTLEKSIKNVKYWKTQLGVK